ncbi:MAG: ATP synthase F0 subunit B [Candidatus Binatia bacterium]
MLTFPPDISFVIQIFSFLVLWFGLKRLLFDPVLQVLEERQARTVGTRRAAAAARATAEQSQAACERRLHEVRLALSAEMEAARAATQNAERELLSQVRDQASAQLMQLRASLARELDAVRPAVASAADALAARMLGQVMGKQSS